MTTKPPRMNDEAFDWYLRQESWDRLTLAEWRAVLYEAQRARHMERHHEVTGKSIAEYATALKEALKLAEEALAHLIREVTGDPRALACVDLRHIDAGRAALSAVRKARGG